MYNNLTISLYNCILWYKCEVHSMYLCITIIIIYKLSSAGGYSAPVDTDTIYKPITCVYAQHLPILYIVYYYIIIHIIPALDTLVTVMNNGTQTIVCVYKNLLMNVSCGCVRSASVLGTQPIQKQNDPNY